MIKVTYHVFMLHAEHEGEIGVGVTVLDHNWIVGKVLHLLTSQFSQ